MLVRSLDKPLKIEKMTRAPWWERNLAWLLLSPTIVMFLLFAFAPTFYSVRYGLSHVRLIRGQLSLRFIGLDNFSRALDDDLVRQAVRTTLQWTIVVTLAEVVLGLLLALLMTQNIRFRPALISILIIPIILPPVSVAIAWRYMYNLQSGIFTYVLDSLGLGSVGWLSDSSGVFDAAGAPWIVGWLPGPIEHFLNVPVALLSMMVVDIWQATPFTFILLSAGLTSLPRDPYEAASIDGASPWFTFKTLTLPMLRPVLLVVVLLRLIDSARIFDKVFLMTNGGPGTTGYTMTLTAYVSAFTKLELGYAAAISFLFQLLLIVIGTIYVKRVLSDYAAPSD
jgi:multiple sugar transport system permease protein